MTTNDKLNIIYSYEVYDSPFLIKSKNSLDDGFESIINFLADSEKVSINQRDVSRISHRLDSVDYFYNGLLCLDEVTIEKNFDMISRGEDVYGEVTRSGVDKLYSHIKQVVGENLSNLSFVDLGMGKGKLVLHLSLLANFKRLVGIELSKNKYKKSLQIKEHSDIFDSRVDLQNCNIFEVDLMDFDVLFFNDVCFNQNLRSHIFSGLKTGSFIIVSKECDLSLVKSINLDCSWCLNKQFYIYRK